MSVPGCDVLAREKAGAEDLPADRQRVQIAAAQILEIQKRVKPDPEAWTIRNYIDYF